MKAVDVQRIPGTDLLVPVNERGHCEPTPCGRCGHLAGLLRNTGGVTVCMECPDVPVVTLDAAEVASWLVRP